MPIVRFLNVEKEVEVEHGSSILDAARVAGAPEGDRCGGVCACSTCHVYVKAGLEQLSEAEDEELDILEKAFAPEFNSRLGCQAKLEGEGPFEIVISQESYEAFLDEHADQKEQVAAKWREVR